MLSHVCSHRYHEMLFTVTSHAAHMACELLLGRNTFNLSQFEGRPADGRLLVPDREICGNRVGVAGLLTLAFGLPR